MLEEFTVALETTEDEEEEEEEEIEVVVAVWGQRMSLLVSTSQLFLTTLSRAPMVKLEQTYLVENILTNQWKGVSLQPEGLSEIIFILELKCNVCHRQCVFTLYFVHCRLQFLTRKKLKVLTVAQTLSHPSFQVVAGPVVIKQRTQRFCFTTICFILVTNLNQMAYIITEEAVKKQAQREEVTNYMKLYYRQADVIISSILAHLNNDAIQ